MRACSDRKCVLGQVNRGLRPRIQLGLRLALALSGALDGARVGAFAAFVYVNEDEVDVGELSIAVDDVVYGTATMSLFL